MAFYECPFHPYREEIPRQTLYKHSATIKGYVTTSIETIAKLRISKAMLGADTMSNRECVVNMDGSTNSDKTKTKLEIVGYRYIPATESSASYTLSIPIYVRDYATSAISYAEFNTGDLDYDYIEITAGVKSSSGSHRTAKTVSVELW